MPGITIHDHKLQFHKVGSYPVNFEAANQDTSGAQFQYFGFISSFGTWIVMRFEIIASTIIYSYAGGTTRADYDGHWNALTGRYIAAPALTFATFDQLGDNL